MYLRFFLFSDKNDGIFLDIDGNHPITINNTYYFEKIGWTGLAFEPLKGIIACGGTINPMLAL